MPVARLSVALALVIESLAGCGSGPQAPEKHHALSDVSRCLKQHGLSVERSSDPTGSMLPDRADEGELTVNGAIPTLDARLGRFAVDPRTDMSGTRSSCRSRPSGTAPPSAAVATSNVCESVRSAS